MANWIKKKKVEKSVGIQNGSIKRFKEYTAQFFLENWNFFGLKMKSQLLTNYLFNEMLK